MYLVTFPVLFRACSPGQYGGHALKKKKISLVYDLRINYYVKFSIAVDIQCPDSRIDLVVHSRLAPKHILFFLFLSLSLPPSLSLTARRIPFF